MFLLTPINLKRKSILESIVNYIIINGKIILIYCKQCFSLYFGSYYIKTKDFENIFNKNII